LIGWRVSRQMIPERDMKLKYRFVISFELALMHCDHQPDQLVGLTGIRINPFFTINGRPSVLCGEYQPIK